MEVYVTLVGQDIPRSKCWGEVYAMEELNGQIRAEVGELERGDGKEEYSCGRYNELVSGKTK